MQMDQHR